MDKKPTKTDVSAAAAALARRRWDKPKWRSERARSAEMRRVGSFTRHQRGGRPRLPDRCPCGVMTQARAAKRNHRCQAAAGPLK